MKFHLVINAPHLVKKIKHECSFCCKEFYWNENSRWLGSYKVHGIGYSTWEEETVEAKASSAVCAETMKLLEE